VSYFREILTGYCLPDIIDARGEIFIGEIGEFLGKFSGIHNLVGRMSKIGDMDKAN